MAQAELLPVTLGGFVLSLVIITHPAIIEYTGKVIDFLKAEAAAVNIDYKLLKELSIPDAISESATIYSQKIIFYIVNNRFLPCKLHFIG